MLFLKIIRMRNKRLLSLLSIFAIYFNAASQTPVTLQIQRQVIPIHSYNKEKTKYLDSIWKTMPVVETSYLAGDYSDGTAQFSIVTVTTHHGNDAFVTLYLVPYRSDSVYLSQGINETFVNHDSAVVLSVGNSEYSVTVHSGGTVAELQKLNYYKKPDAELKDQNRLPDVSFPLVYGGKSLFSNYEHKYPYIYVEFWGTWCAPCLQIMPLLKDIYSKYKGKICMISLAYSGLGSSNKAMDVNDIKKVVDLHQVEWMQGIADKNLRRLFYENETAPYGILYDSDGNVIKREISPQELSKFLEVKYGKQ